MWTAAKKCGSPFFDDTGNLYILKILREDEKCRRVSIFDRKNME